MPNYAYDLIVIGGGASGLTSAKLAAGLGKKVAIIEHERLGGECTWTGCIPSKTLIKSAGIAYSIKNAQKFGIKNSTEIDTSNVMQHVRHTVQKVYESHTPEALEKSGITVFKGHPVFLDDHHIELEHKKLRFKKAIIATGSSPSIPNIDGIDSVPYLTNQTLFDLESLPTSMIILGAGAVGVELASALNRLGVKITLIQRSERILPHEDYELTAMLSDIMSSEGVVVKTNMQAYSIMPDVSGIPFDKSSGVNAATTGHHGVKVLARDIASASHEFSAQTLLVATGRKPNVYELGLENAGVHFDNRGIKVDHYLRTTTKHIFACGDVVGPYYFSHMAWYQAVTATRNALIPFWNEKIDYTNRLWVTFSAPELSSMGLTELQAREQYGDCVVVYSSSYSQIDRAYTDNATDGMIKCILDRKGYILGAQILGERAGDIIGELQVAKVRGIKFADLYKVLHAYPTVSELIWKVAKKAYIDRLQKNYFIRLVKKIIGKF